jgi:hypothetical protein
MSSLWTPSGERPVPRQPPDPVAEPSPPSGSGPGRSTGEPPGEALDEDEVRRQLSEMRDRLAATPAEVVVANHAFGLFELAALHLSLDPPQMPQARLAIDALTCLVDGLGDRLGENAEQLRDGLGQLRMAYVEIHEAHNHGAQLHGTEPG